MYGESRGVYRVLVRKPEGKRPLGSTSHRWEIILRRSIRMCVGGLRIGTSDGHL